MDNSNILRSSRRSDDIMDVLLNEDSNNWPPSHTTSHKRNKFTAFFKNQNFLRPEYALNNSRAIN
jgi:hypothetical protein